MDESVLDREVLGKWRLEQVLHLLLFVIAVGLACYSLGPRPYHHDESIHASYAWKITRNGLLAYRYDPVYHGTVLYYAAAAVIWLFGDSDFTGRLSAVLFGLGVLAFAWPLRRYLGRWGALAFATLTVFSPSWLYFERFVRHDIYLALCNMGAVYFAFRWGESRKIHLLPISAMFLGLGFATKEDNYFLAPSFLIAFAGILLWEWLAADDRERPQTAQRLVGEVKDLFRAIPQPLMLSAIAFLIPWTVFYSGFFQNEKYWDWHRPWIVFQVVPDAIHYWTGQHGVERIGGPWWYYIPSLSLYEPLLILAFLGTLSAPILGGKARGVSDRITRWLSVIGLINMLLAAVYPDYGAFKLSEHANVKVGTATMAITFAAAIYSLCRVWLPDRFLRFCILWAIAALIVYSWAQEKVPWLLVPMVQPLLLIAGRWWGDAIAAGRLQGRRVWGVGALAVLTLWTLFNANYRWDALWPAEPGAKLNPPRRHHEMLAYVQSTYDIPMVLSRIEEVAAKLGTGTQTRLAIGGDATWPLSWYLRHYPVNWSQNLREVDYPALIVDHKEPVEKSFDTALLATYEKVPFAIRGWWTWEHKFPSLGGFVKFLLFRETWSGVGSSDAVLYVRKDVKPGMTIEKITVNPPPPAVPWGSELGAEIDAQAVWGEKGVGPGQFNEPRGLAVDAAGNLYVADSKNHRIQKLSPAGQVLGVWGSEGAEDGKFKEPQSVAIGPDGNVYVADTWNHRVQKLDPNGKFLAKWGEGLWGPRGIAVGPDGSVYIADTGHKRVVRYSATGETLKAWGVDGSGDGEFIEPVGLTVDTEGRLAVADTGNHRIQFFDVNGKFVQKWGVKGWTDFFTEPHLARLGKDILATDSTTHRFARYRGDMNVVGTWGRAGATGGKFNRPIGIAATDSGTVYVSDTQNHRVQKFQLPPG